MRPLSIANSLHTNQRTRWRTNSHTPFFSTVHIQIFREALRNDQCVVLMYGGRVAKPEFLNKDA